MAHGRLEGCQTFDDHLFDLYGANRITEEVALAGADSANDLKLRIRLESGETTDQPAFHINGR
jgi:twitching motility protein PilU